MTQAVQLASYGSTGHSLGFKNRIINGDMRIDQRNAGASVTLSAAENRYPVDRFPSYASVGTVTAQQSSTAPAGFTNSIVYTVTSPATVSGSDNVRFAQNIEGYNMADFGWGTSNAKTITISFWVRSSLTGTFSGSLRNSASDRSYVFSYTINSANTWEYETITIPGDTTGTWLTTNGVGIRLFWSLGVGSTFQTAAGSWVSGTYYAPPGSVSVVGTSGATFYLTGVQLEVGSSATPFDTRSYGTEMALCQRYYQRITATGSNVTKPRFAIGFPVNTTTTQFTLYPFVPLRATPTLSYSNLIVTNNVSFDKPVTSLDTNLSNTNIVSVYISCSSAGLTQFSPVMLAVSYADSSGFIDFSSEL